MALPDASSELPKSESPETVHETLSPTLDLAPLASAARYAERGAVGGSDLIHFPSSGSPASSQSTSPAG